MRGSVDADLYLSLATRGTKKRMNGTQNTVVGCHPSQPSLNNGKSKRKRYSPLPVSDNEAPSRTPLYLVATRLDGESFIPVNTFIISNAIESNAGDVEDMKKLRDGSVLIKCATQEQSINLMKCKHCGEYGVENTTQAISGKLMRIMVISGPLS